MDKILNQSSIQSKSFSQNEIKRIQCLLRATISKARKKGINEAEAVNNARRLIPHEFPTDKLPKAFQGKASYQPTDKEVNQLLNELEDEGKVRYLSGTGTSQDDKIEKYRAKPGATTEQQCLQEKSQPGATQRATSRNQVQPGATYNIKTMTIYAFQLCLYAVLVPTTASVVSTALEGLTSPLPIVFISYAIALAIDFVGLAFLSSGLKATGKLRQENLAIAALVLLINMGGLAYKSHSEARAENEVKIEMQKLEVEKSRLHWLESKWRNEADPVACERSPSICKSTPYTKASRSRQNKYQLELAKLKLLKDWSLDYFHLAYFGFLWALLGALGLLAVRSGELDKNSSTT